MGNHIIYLFMYFMIIRYHIRLKLETRGKLSNIMKKIGCYKLNGPKGSRYTFNGHNTIPDWDLVTDQSLN